MPKFLVDKAPIEEIIGRFDLEKSTQFREEHRKNVLKEGAGKSSVGAIFGAFSLIPQKRKLFSFWGHGSQTCVAGCKVSSLRQLFDFCQRQLVCAATILSCESAGTFFRTCVASDQAKSRFYTPRINLPILFYNHGDQTTFFPLENSPFPESWAERIKRGNVEKRDLEQIFGNAIEKISAFSSLYRPDCGEIRPLQLPGGPLILNPRNLARLSVENRFSCIGKKVVLFSEEVPPLLPTKKLCEISSGFSGERAHFIEAIFSLWCKFDFWMQTQNKVAGKDSFQNPKRFFFGRARFKDQTIEDLLLSPVEQGTQFGFYRKKGKYFQYSSCFGEINISPRVYFYQIASLFAFQEGVQNRFFDRMVSYFESLSLTEREAFILGLIERKNTRALILLLERWKAERLGSDSLGEPLLYRALQHEVWDFVYYLLKRGIVDGMEMIVDCDRKGRSFIHFIVDQPLILEKLLSIYPEGILAHDSKGRSPFDYAKNPRSLEILRKKWRELIVYTQTTSKFGF